MDLITNFFLIVALEIHSFRKNLFWRSLWMMSCCTLVTPQNLRCPCKPIILSIGFFEGPTEVPMNSWWKAASLWSRSSDRMQAKTTIKSSATPNLKIDWFAKKVLWKSSRLVHMELKELLIHSDGLANQSFCQSDISRAQLKSTWTVGERLLASYQSQFDNGG